MITQEQILLALREVEHPAKDRDILSLGIVEGVDITDNKVTVTLAFQGRDPLADYLIAACKSAVKRTAPQCETEVRTIVKERKPTKKQTGLDLGMEEIEHIGKIIAVSSGKGGVGKSTVAVNLAMTLAFAGKKVLFIETDLRNGFDYRLFKVDKSSKGLATYLSGTDSLEQVLRRGVLTPNLDVILRGAMPPNPNELLSGSRMSALIEEMKNKYDYVICDSAPYVIISDPIVVNNYTDATFYVVRCGVSDLRFIDEINFASESGRLKNISIIINGINPKTKIYGKYGGYGYGYGYGYGGREEK